MPVWTVRRLGVASIVALSLCLAVKAAEAQLAPIQAETPPVTGVRHLVLEVLINGVSTHEVEPFWWVPPNRFATTRSNLEEMGIAVPGHADGRQMVDLETIPGIGIRFDEPGQRIDVLLGDHQRRTQVFDARGDVTVPRPRADWGGLVNYSLYATSLGQPMSGAEFSGLNATLDTRLFSPVGTILQSGILGDTVASGTSPGSRSGLRLDTTLLYAAPDRLTVVRAGDTISGGLAWTRPFRYGGAQAQRDFTLRPDLVTSPVPSVNGSAAVPSTVDIYLNNIRTFTQQVGPGPYQITNLPIVSNSGQAQVVVTDASGQALRSSLALFASPKLLAQDMTDFSLDAGFARRFYGTVFDDYDTRPLGSVSLRRGFSDWFTAEGHAEGGAGLVEGGVGGLVGFGPMGTLSLAAAASLKGADAGAQGFVAYATDIGRLNIDVSSQRTFGSFQDLASVTAPRNIGRHASSGSTALSLVASFLPGTAGFDPRPPRALDRLSFGAQIPFDPTYVNFSIINLVEADRTPSRIVSVSLSRPLPHGASLFGAVFVDFTRQRSAGLSVGLTVPIGGGISLAASSSGGGRSSNLDAQKTLQPVDGSTGWHLQDIEGRAPYRSAEASYRSPYGTLIAGAQQQAGRFGGSAEIDGSIAALGGSIMPGNRVDDGFAIVDAGMAGVEVTRDNRPIGVTNGWGKLLVLDLQSYQTNRIGIDPANLPLTAEAKTTRVAIAPARQSGVYVDFGVNLDVRGAVVVLVGPDGKALPPGSRGRLEGANQDFVVGYDGQAYLKGLDAHNVVSVDAGDTQCRAEFAYRTEGPRQPKIGPVPCR